MQSNNTYYPLPTNFVPSPQDANSDQSTSEDNNEIDLQQINQPFPINAFISSISKNALGYAIRNINFDVSPQINSSIQLCKDIVIDHPSSLYPIELPMTTRNCPRITIALDLDETLITSSLQPLKKVDHEINISLNGTEATHVYLSMRPYLKEFLKEISSYLEVVIFTASQKEYADKVIKLIDPDRKYIRHRLYRGSCTNTSGLYVKELGHLNRDLSKVIIVDNSLISLVADVDNSILIKNYEGDPADVGLIFLSYALKSICKYDDLRIGIRKVLDS